MKTWVKVLGIISIILLAFLLIISIITYIGISSGAWDSMGMLIVGFSIWVWGVIIALWLLGFLISWIIKKIK
jgi:hypothetical protein